MKRSRQLLSVVAFTVSVFLATAGNNACAESKLLTMGTGGVTGVYYPAGVAIGSLVNDARKTHCYRMAIESTTGSRYNVNAVAHGELDFGIVQSDVQYQAEIGTGSFKKTGKVKEIRSVFSLFPEQLYIIARADAGINNLAELKGKRLNIGNRGSGQLETFNVLKEVMGWTEKDFAQTTTLKSTEQGAALCANKVDAIFFTVADQSAVIKTITESCDTVFVQVDESITEKLKDKYPNYFPAIIPGGMYKGIPNATKTFAIRTTLITNEDVSERTVYQVTKAVFERFDTLTKAHPALQGLKKEEMIKFGLTAPLHKGAVKYYKEAGLM